RVLKCNRLTIFINGDNLNLKTVHRRILGGA
ncbi:MAG: hypothetical protein RL753_904, partial [Bacteroidota bacterium]